VNSRIVLTSLAAVLIAVAGCSGSTTGEAKPTPDTGSSSASGNTSRTTTSSPTSTAGGSSLGDTDPCSLLTKSEAEQVTGPLRENPAPNNLGSAKGCEFKPKGKNLGVDIRTNVGLAGVQAPGEVIDLTIGGHQAKKFVASGGSCVVAMGVTSSSRVDVTLNAGGVDDPCPLAVRVAELVEPRLP